MEIEAILIYSLSLSFEFSLKLTIQREEWSVVICLWLWACEFAGYMLILGHIARFCHIFTYNDLMVKTPLGALFWNWYQKICWWNKEELHYMPFVDATEFRYYFNHIAPPFSQAKLAKVLYRLSLLLKKFSKGIQGVESAWNINFCLNIGKVQIWSKPQKYLLILRTNHQKKPCNTKLFGKFILLNYFSQRSSLT